jgi:DNA replication protein DnaC
MKQILDNIENAVPVDSETYTGQDGLLHCNNCGGKRQTKIKIFDKEKIVPCVCECILKEKEADKQRWKDEEIERKRRICFDKPLMLKWTFENDKYEYHQMQIAENYVKHFEDMKKQNIGLLLWGEVGNGKSYTAASIANALIDKGYSVKMTSVPALANKLQGMWEGKDVFINSLMNYDLLIIDDLGVERKTEYMQETVYNIIEARYGSGLPMIVTTNLTNEQLKYTDNITLQRVYDRVMALCTPVKFEGTSYRKRKLAENYKQVKEKLGL